jgi:hypothetical protein
MIHIEKIKSNILQKLSINNKNISVNLVSHQNTRSESDLSEKRREINPSLSDMEFTWLEEYY